MNCVARLVSIISLTLSMPAVFSMAQEHAGAGPSDSSHLGKVYFPTSCSAEAQPLLEKGLALLHSFQYTEARQTFEQAQGRDTKCAMAHWGKAMSFYEQLWDFPDKEQLKEGHQEIKAAEQLDPKKPLELGLLRTAAVFYQEDPQLGHVERTRAYSAALGQLFEQMPEDVEVGAYRALSLVALAKQEVDSLANQRKAIAILEPLFENYPDHPGVAHYLIHAADRPELAPEGLAAARRYAAIAPDSAHALHMPSHIFVRLGLWQDSIDSNIAAQAAGARAAELHQAEAHYQTHAMDYLNYSYLQSGQEAKAREVVRHMDHVVGANEEQKAEHRADLEARTALELHRWKEAAGLKIPLVAEAGQDSTHWARAIGAARSGDLATAEAAVKELSKSVEEREARARRRGDLVSRERASDLREAEAWLAYAQGKTDEALTELRAAAEQEEKNGGESVVIPSREMLADMLRELGRAPEALVEYKMVLKNAPNRFDALLGAGRAAEATGDTSGAQSYFAKLARLCPAGADRPELAEAKSELAKKST
jgi:tetratricopeptide (TPR) repeat protein